MPGTNLTREEARQRATLLTVDSYEIDLDLTGAQEGGTYRSVTTVRFDVAEGGGESFIDLVAPTVHEVTLNGDSPRCGRGVPGLPHRPAGAAAGRNILRVAADCAYTDTGEGLHRFVDPEDDRAFLYTQFELAAVGRFGGAEIQSEYERDKTAAGERHAATARAARPTEAAKAEAWESVVESDKLPNAVQEAVIAGFVQTDQRELLASYTERYFEALKGVWESRSHEMAQQIAVGLYPAVQVSQETLDRTDAWLASAEPNAALRRLVSESRSGIERALKAQAADAAAAE
ncbi:hypothetical protein STENM327S_01192 [Streptomyces tendae]